MSFLGGIGDAIGDVAGGVWDIVEAGGDLAGAAAPFVTLVNPAAGMALSQYAQYSNMAEGFIDGGKGGGGGRQAQITGGASEFFKGPKISGDESLAVLLAKVFGAQMDKTEKELRSLASDAAGGTGEGAASKNALIAAKASDLTNQASIASKTISAVSESQTTSLGRTS
jgi:hypothetical protein